MREAAALRPYRICFKDVGGMLTPERTRTLVKLVLDNAAGVPVEFHAHCNNGLAPVNVLEAVRQGITIIHTSVPPLANGSAQPSIFNVARNLKAMGYEPQVNERALEPVERHFRWIAKREGLPIGAPREYDQSWYRHQVPGGMISNLSHQLKMLGKEGRIEEVLDEIVRVRAELGYPIMVTPFAQFVGSQAAINVMTGERYKEVTDQVIQYACGKWGKEGSEQMDAEIRGKILDRPRARELAAAEIPDVSLSEIRQRYGGPDLSDEELLLRYYAGLEFVEALKSAPPRKEYLDARQPLARLIDELNRRRDLAHVYICKGALRIAMRR
jgi:oxaloacetate decarboxylase alpha subunit